MTQTFAVVLSGGFDLGTFVLDLPRPDRCSQAGYRCAVDAILAARAATGARTAVLASLPEAIDEDATAELEAGGVAVLHGMEAGLAAIDAAIRAGRLATAEPPALLGGAGTRARTLSEAEAKAALAARGLRVPASATASGPEGIGEAADGLRFPVALKALGVAHKTEAGAVVLNLADARALRAAADRLAPLGTGLLAEEMAPEGVELLVGVTRDATGLLALTLGAGGVWTEVLRDSATLILPASREEVRDALLSLRLAPLLRGYRGAPPADLDALLDAVAAVAAYAEAEAPRLIELDVNPLIASPSGAVAVDALIRLEAP